MKLNEIYPIHILVICGVIASELLNGSVFVRLVYKKAQVYIPLVHLLLGVSRSRLGASKLLNIECHLGL
jgi:hypothetical protein